MLHVQKDVLSIRIFRSISGLTGEGKYKEALEVILEKNPLPFITGTLCAHNCMSKCTRNFYEEPVNIRGTKLIAAQKGYEELIGQIKGRRAQTVRRLLL